MRLSNRQLVGQFDVERQRCLSCWALESQAPGHRDGSAMLRHKRLDPIADNEFQQGLRP